jgi:hypothetical protein
MSELGRTLATAVDSQMQALIAEALAKHKTEINDGVDSLTDRLAQLRTSLDGIQDTSGPRRRVSGQSWMACRRKLTRAKTLSTRNSRRSKRI